MVFESDSGSSDFSLVDPLELEVFATLRGLLGISLCLEDELDEAPPEADDDPLELEDELPEPDAEPLELEDPLVEGLT